MNSLLLKFLSSADEPSSKRLGGILCIIVGLLMKMILLAYGLKYIIANSFDKLDGSADSVLLAGAALLGSTLFEKKNGIAKSDS
jgi:hypothetical protein